MIWIGYTTLYREGGRQFRRAAQTLARSLKSRDPGAEVVCHAVESKREFVEAMMTIARAGKSLDELHFIGHGGMYGPMFRSTAMPEQFSPHEWRQLQLPFAPRARAYFHTCRSGRWFAPFFARTFDVAAYGYHGYTTFSTRSDRFRPELPWTKDDTPLYVVACPGRKSHGLLVAAAKYAGLVRTEKMQCHEPERRPTAADYDDVAHLYDEVFADIGVRADEWAWLEPRIVADAPKRVLDLGCGNGALLTKLADRILTGTGVDQSPAMIERARARAGRFDNLEFHAIDGPVLPFADASFDIVVSLLSFRYLDWDPILNEIRRVLAPHGRLLIVDMATVPVRTHELPRFAFTKLRQIARDVTRPRYRRALRKLVRDPRWSSMLAYNPIRALHEYEWYLCSRFPGRNVEVLNIGWHARVLAFDSGPLQPGWVAPQSYP